MKDKMIIAFVFAVAFFAFFLTSRNKADVNPEPAPLPTATSDNTDSGQPFTAPCGYTTTIGQGPYYVSGAPLLTDGNLNYSASPGETLILSGYILDGIENPTPIANAEIDIWQTDASGDYHPLGSGDASDYNANELELRGIVKTNEYGYYSVQTILPEEYSGRPRHIHVKVRAPGKPELTTQLYWQQPGDENIVSDSDINTESRECQILTAVNEEGTLQSSYDFYLK